MNKSKIIKTIIKIICVLCLAIILGINGFPELSFITIMLGFTIFCLKRAITLLSKKNEGKQTKPDTCNVRKAEKKSTEVSFKWYGYGQAVRINNYIINDGMIYVGKTYPSTSYGNQKHDSSVIDPSLPIKPFNFDDSYNRNLVDYYPEYKSISPEARNIYLIWLSSGRSDTKIEIGYVFLFYYGLERRILVDGEREILSYEEKEYLHNEIYRLISIYGGNKSFYSYASSFVGFMEAKYPDLLPRPELLNGDSYTFDYPYWLKLKLANYSIKGLPIPGDLACEWFLHCPDAYLKIPATRCAKEFSKLFQLKYTDTFDAGMIIKPNKTNVSATYHPANGSLSGKMFTEHSIGLPDITKLKSPIDSLKKIGDICMSELDSYSRFLGRRPDDINSIYALSLLPDSLLKEIKHPIKDSLFALLDNIQQDGNLYTVKISELLKTLEIVFTKNLSQSDSVLICQFLERNGIGIEPDIRFGGAKLNPQEMALLYHLDEKSMHAPSDEYMAALLLLRLASLVCHADGVFSMEEKDKLKSYVESLTQLDEPEKHRLTAHIHYLCLTPPQFTGIKKKIGSLDVHAKNEIAKYLAFISACDGNVDPEEIKALKKIYNLLGLDDSFIYSNIHNIQASKFDDPVVLTTGDTPASVKNFSIPSPPVAKDKHEVILDSAVLDRTLHQTQQVQSLLASIFVEQEEINTISSQTKDDNDAMLIDGLDKAHSQLFERICKVNSLPMDEFEDICRELSLLPMGAIETLNNMSFDSVSEIFIEPEEDLLLVNNDIVQEILA